MRQTRVFNAAQFAMDVRTVREQRKMSTRDLCAMCGVSCSYISQLERSFRGTVPGINIILWLCDWMGRPLESYIISI